MQQSFPEIDLGQIRLTLIAPPSKMKKQIIRSMRIIRKLILEKSQNLIKKESKSIEELDKEYVELTDAYSQLLEETRLITRVSDRLQNKINRAHDTLSLQSEKINTINSELQNNNVALKSAIQQLTKAKVSNKTTTIVLTFAIFLFFISEGLVEPIIERRVESFWLGLLFKGSIVLLLKPIEMVVEKYFDKKSTGQDKIVEDLLS